MAIEDRADIQMVSFATLRALLSCCCKDSGRRLEILSKGEGRIDKQLDVIRLYKQLKMMDQAIRILLTDGQRRLIRHSRDFTIDSSDSG